MKKEIKINFYLCLCLLAFFIISIFSIYSAASMLPNYYNYLYIKQILWYFVGIIFLFLIKFIKNDRIYRYSIFFYIFSCSLLLFLLIFGEEINGIKGWFYIGSLSFQPSELAKISLILIFSTVLNEFHFKENKSSKEELKLIIKIFSLALLPSILTFIEPDSSSAITYFFIAFIMLFISGIKKRWFLLFIIFISFILLTFFILYFKFKNVFIDFFSNDFYYRIKRLIDWKNSSGMQLENSLIAVGSSGLLGYGFNNTPIYIPEPSNDFIFSVYTSNFGLIGAFTLILFIIIFDNLIIKIALKSSITIDKYLISGIVASLVFNQIQNIGMTIGFLPITGIPLPFISYGGSSLIIYFIMISLCINANKKMVMFKN